MPPALEGIDALIARMEEMEAELVKAEDQRHHFHATYRRTTQAVRDELARGGFLDTDWVERWDVAFAQLYVDALEQWERGETPSAPWNLAFTIAADSELRPLAHVLLGINAHINYDLPQALLAVISDEEFDDPSVIERREQDHMHLDLVLAARVAAENEELLSIAKPGDVTTLDRLLKPLNQAGTKRFLREARQKVWHNARLLSRARRRGEAALAGRLRDLEELSRARVAELSAPGQILLKLAVKGFGVTLPG